jgi:hypothetical protein
MLALMATHAMMAKKKSVATTMVVPVLLKFASIAGLVAKDGSSVGSSQGGG